jgi:hypothetical protein
VIRQDLGRFLPDRSQFMLLIGVFVILFAAAGFINLALTKSEALAARRVAQQKYDQLGSRNLALKDALGEAQQGLHIEPMAMKFFGLVPPGFEVITAAPEDPIPEIETGSPFPLGPPYWEEWFKKLLQP